jgi:hypothetical protein
VCFKKAVSIVIRSLFQTDKGGTKGTSQERAMIEQMEFAIRAENPGVARRIRQGDVVFRLLYGVFGADIIAYLFDQAWVPATRLFHSGLDCS